MPQYTITVNPVPDPVNVADIVKELMGLGIFTSVNQVNTGTSGIVVAYDSDREDAPQCIRDVITAHVAEPLLTNGERLKVLAIAVAEGKDPHALATKVSLEMLERGSAGHRAWSNALLAAMTTLISQLRAKGIDVGDDILTGLTPLFYFATHADAVNAAKAQVEATTVEL
jgi:hypothetical protein